MQCDSLLFSSICILHNKNPGHLLPETVLAWVYSIVVQNPDIVKSHQVLDWFQRLGLPYEQEALLCL